MEAAHSGELGGVRWRVASLQQLGVAVFGYDGLGHGVVLLLGGGSRWWRGPPFGLSGVGLRRRGRRRCGGADSLGRAAMMSRVLPGFQSERPLTLTSSPMACSSLIRSAMVSPSRS